MSDSSNGAGDAGQGVPERSKVLEETLKLSPETAQAAAANESATGMRKPGPNEVDEARAAQARATEPAEGGASNP